MIIEALNSIALEVCSLGYLPSSVVSVLIGAYTLWIMATDAAVPSRWTRPTLSLTTWTLSLWIASSWVDLGRCLNYLSCHTAGVGYMRPIVVGYAALTVGVGFDALKRVSLPARFTVSDSALALLLTTVLWTGLEFTYRRGLLLRTASGTVLDQADAYVAIGRVDRWLYMASCCAVLAVLTDVAGWFALAGRTRSKAVG